MAVSTLLEIQHTWRYIYQRIHQVTPLFQPFLRFNRAGLGTCVAPGRDRVSTLLEIQRATIKILDGDIVWRFQPFLRFNAGIGLGWYGLNRLDGFNPS